MNTKAEPRAEWELTPESEVLLHDFHTGRDEDPSFAELEAIERAAVERDRATRPDLGIADPVLPRDIPPKRLDLVWHLLHYAAYGGAPPRVLRDAAAVIDSYQHATRRLRMALSFNLGVDPDEVDVWVGRLIEAEASTFAHRSRTCVTHRADAREAGGS